MNQERLTKILLGPHTSEKSENVAEKFRHVVFKVLPDATKLEVKNAIELFFNVKVKHICTLNVQGKKKRFGQRLGARKNWKKAYVALKDGYDIDFAGTEKG